MAVNRELFPKLKDGEFKVTSDATPAYNCIAWAAGVDDVWWEPDPNYYWPNDNLFDDTIESVVSAFNDVGFEICENTDVEPGFEKVAIYGDADGYQHAARQLKNGEWTSKLGKDEDITHSQIDGLEGAAYGLVRVIMKRNYQQDELAT